jgi:hypothetical protein
MSVCKLVTSTYINLRRGRVVNDNLRSTRKASGTDNYYLQI